MHNAHMCALADPAAGFWGAKLARGPSLGYLKTKKSTDLTQYFWRWTQFTFENKNKKSDFEKHPVSVRLWFS